MIKIPRLSGNYWLLMLLCTTMGELIGNLLSRNLELGYTQGAILDVCIYSVLIFLFLYFKLQNDIYYWILILMGNIGGTNLADWITLEPLINDKKWGLFQPLQLGTQWGSLVVLVALLLVLAIRYFVLSRRGNAKISGSVLYWAAIILSSTFGTTSGDLITNDTPLGALGGSLLLLVLLALMYGFYRKNWIRQNTAYWSALVLMHTVGATIGNWVSKPIGLNLGNVYTNIAMAFLFMIIFLKDTRTRENS